MSSEHPSDDSKPKSRLSLREYLRNRNRPGQSSSSSSSSAAPSSSSSSSYSPRSRDSDAAPSSSSSSSAPEPRFRRVPRSPPRPQGVRIPVYHPNSNSDRQQRQPQHRVFEARPGSYDVPVAYGAAPSSGGGGTGAGVGRSSSRWDQPRGTGTGGGTVAQSGVGMAQPVEGYASMIPGIAPGPLPGPPQPHYGPARPYYGQQQQRQQPHVHVPLSQVAPIRAAGPGPGHSGPQSHVHLSAPPAHAAAGPIHTRLGPLRREPLQSSQSQSVIGVGMKRDRHQGGLGGGGSGIPGIGGSGSGFYGHFSHDRRMNMNPAAAAAAAAAGGGTVSYGPAMKRRRMMSGPGAAAVLPSRPGVAVAGSASTGAGPGASGSEGGGAGPPPRQGDGLFVSFGKKIFIPWSEVRNEGALPTRMIVCFKYYHAGSCYTKDCDMVHVSKVFLNQFRDKPSSGRPQAAVRPRKGRGGGGGGGKKSKSEKKILLWFPTATFQVCTGCGKPHQIPTSEAMLEGFRTLEESMENMRTGPQTGGDVRIPHANEVRLRFQTLASVYGLHKSMGTYPAEVIHAMERAKEKLRRLTRKKKSGGGRGGRRRRR